MSADRAVAADTACRLGGEAKVPRDGTAPAGEPQHPHYAL